MFIIIFYLFFPLKMVTFWEVSTISGLTWKAFSTVGHSATLTVSFLVQKMHRHWSLNLFFLDPDFGLWSIFYSPNSWEQSWFWQRCQDSSVLKTCTIFCFVCRSACLQMEDFCLENGWSCSGRTMSDHEQTWQIDMIDLTVPAYRSWRPGTDRLPWPQLIHRFLEAHSVWKANFTADESRDSKISARWTLTQNCRRLLKTTATYWTSKHFRFSHAHKSSRDQLFTCRW
jgi:hypothetical protein